MAKKNIVHNLVLHYLAPADSVAAGWEEEEEDGPLVDPRGDLGAPAVDHEPEFAAVEDPRGDLGAPAVDHEPEFAAADLGDGSAPANSVGFGLIGGKATAPGPMRCAFSAEIASKF